MNNELEKAVNKYFNPNSSVYKKGFYKLWVQENFKIKDINEYKPKNQIKNIGKLVRRSLSSEEYENQFKLKPFKKVYTINAKTTNYDKLMQKLKQENKL